MIRIAMIVAAADNDVIGRGNALPWHLPEDLRYFKRTTMGKPIIMGRKTFSSIGKPLPGRSNIVVTRNQDFAAKEGLEGLIKTASSIDEAIGIGRADAQSAGVEEVFIIGGSQIYEKSLAAVDRLYLTQVHAVIDGDTFLPAIDWSAWREASRERHHACESNPHDYSFVVYERVE